MYAKDVANVAPSTDSVVAFTAPLHAISTQRAEETRATRHALTPAVFRSTDARVRFGRINHRADRSGTYVFVGGHLSVAWDRLERRCVGVRADGHAVLQVGRVRLRDDVERPRSVLMFMFVRRPDGIVGGRRWGLSGGERGLLEGSKGGVEGAAERPGANVFGGGSSGAECGHGWD